jgi:hypothetical protein
MFGATCAYFMVTGKVYSKCINQGSLLSNTYYKLCTTLVHTSESLYGWYYTFYYFLSYPHMFYIIFICYGSVLGIVR